MSDSMFPQKKADDSCSCWSPKKPYGCKPYCRDCHFVVTDEMPSIEVGITDVVYLCANYDGKKREDYFDHANRVVDFYSYCGGFKDKETGENFDDAYDRLSNLYFERCQYIYKNKDGYIEWCQKNDKDLSKFHEDLYRLKEVHKKHLKENYSQYNYQKFELAKSLYDVMTGEFNPVDVI